jgi:hypothetical protein
MFRPTSGHPQFHNWSLKHTELETYIMQVLCNVCFFLTMFLKAHCEPEDDLTYAETCNYT